MLGAVTATVRLGVLALFVSACSGQVGTYELRALVGHAPSVLWWFCSWGVSVVGFGLLGVSWVISPQVS